MIKYRFFTLFILVSSIIFSNKVIADNFKTDDYVKLQTSVSKENVKQDEVFFVLLTIDVADGWKTYSFEDQINEEGIGPATIELLILEEEAAEVNGKPLHMQLKRKYDEGFEFDVDYIDGKFEVIIPLKANRNLDFSKDKIDLEVFLMICDAERCLPPEALVTTLNSSLFNPTDYEFFNEVNTEENDNNTEIKDKTESQEEIDSAKSKGIFGFLWFAMVAGAGALLTPCVFPMIPITVSFFTKRAEKEKSNGLKDSIIYSLGIIITFTGLGFLLAALLGPTGIRDFAAHGWVNIFIAVIFVVFALNLFGAFEIQLPTGLMNKLNAKSQGGGIASLLLMGLVFSLTSFTCTVPFVGSALISATGGEWFYPIIGMLGFSTVFAAPFFLLALFPSMLNKLPKAGGWMNNLKVIMGFLEIAAAVKFISNADLVWEMGIMPREAFLAIWIACGVLIVVYILGGFRMKLDSPHTNLSATRVVWGVLFGSITIFLIPGLFGKPLGELDAFLPPLDYMGSGTVASSGILSTGISNPDEADFWYKDYDEALKISKEQNKPLFIDFTGWTCTNCRWMESNVFPLPKVKKYMNEMVKVKLYTDRRKEPELSNKKMQEERYGSIELPLYVILTPDEKMIATKTFTRDLEEFIEFLKKGLN